LNRVDFYFDFISPYSYLAATQVTAFSEKHRVSFEWIPVNLPKLIKLSGNTPPGMIRNKALYSLRDLKRWADYLQVPFKMIRPGTFDSRPALRIAAALRGEERERFCLGVFDSLWQGDVDPTEENWLAQAVKANGFPEAWLSLCNDVLDENTESALKAGAFGVPTFILHGRKQDAKQRPEMFFGLDHLEFLARACR